MGLFLVLSTTHGESAVSRARTRRCGDKEPTDQLGVDLKEQDLERFDERRGTVERGTGHTRRNCCGQEAKGVSDQNNACISSLHFEDTVTGLHHAQ